MIFGRQSLIRKLIRDFRNGPFFRFKVELSALKRRAMPGMTVIGITGSSAKTTTTGILRHILMQDHKVTGNIEDNAISATARAIRQAPVGTRFAILEIAAGNEPSIRTVTRMARPDIAIITMIRLEHASAYRTTEAIAKEKGHLLEGLRPGGLAIMNADDEVVMSMAARTSARVVTFGESVNADYRARNISVDLADGLRMRITGCGHDFEVTSQLFGRHLFLPVLAAVACALELGLDPHTVRAAVGSYRGLVDRCGVIRVEDGPVFLMETWKAPAHSMRLPMDTLASVTATRKTIVIGQISDYRGNSKKPYKEAVVQASTVADRVFTVGSSSRRIAASAAGPDTEHADFSRVQDLVRHLQQTAIPGEVILLKSSNNLHLERVALAFKTDVQCWADECGQQMNCFDCRLHGVAFPDQPGASRERKKLREKFQYAEHLRINR